MRSELDAERGGPVDDVVVQLREHLDEVQPIAYEVEAELLEVLLCKQEDGATVNIVCEEVGREIAEAERVEPCRQLFPIPSEHVPMQPKHLQIRQSADRRKIGRD